MKIKDSMKEKVKGNTSQTGWNIELNRTEVDSKRINGLDSILGRKFFRKEESLKLVKI
jgi:hypothetical protein